MKCVSASSGYRWLASRQGRRIAATIVAVAVLCSLPSSEQASAAEPAALEPAPAAAAAPAIATSQAITVPPTAPPMEAAPSPGLDLKASAPVSEPAKPSLFRRWWFWAAVGAAAAATVAVIVVSSSGSAPPASDLGNQEFQP